MHVQLDFRSGQPIYMQLVEQVRQLISRGDLHPGDQLPTVRQLATELRVNFNTVARAYRLLDETGLISTQLGRGTYVWELPSEEITHELRWKGLQELTQHYLEEAARLGYSAQEIAAAFEKGMTAIKETNENRNL